MSRVFITDSEIMDAAIKVNSAMLEGVEAAVLGEHIFSKKFQNRMTTLFKKAKAKRARDKWLKSIAAVFLLFALGTSILLSVDTEVRAEFSQWLREVYESSVVYRFFGGGQEQGLQTYECNWVPEGYLLTDEYRDDNVHMQTYIKDNSIIGIDYEVLSESSLILYQDKDGIAPEKVMVNNIEADLYRANSGSETNNLIWINEKEKLVFSIDSDLPVKEIVRIAENIRKKE